MGRSRIDKKPRSHTLPSSPTHSFSSSSSSSDFEFTVSLCPRKSTSNLIPADELFYKGQLLPLHLSPRLSMVRNLLLASSSSSSSSDTTTTTTTSSRDSSGSSNDSQSDLLLHVDCDSSRPSSVTEEDELKRLNKTPCGINQQNKKTKYFSISRLSSVFRKEPKSTGHPDNAPGSSVKRISSTAKDVIRKYLKKVKPLYEKFSQKQQQKIGNFRIPLTSPFQNLAQKGSALDEDITLSIQNSRKENNGTILHSFSGNLRYPRRRSCVSSCPSSMRSSPNHSGLLSRSDGGSSYTDSSSMEELQSAILGAIAHCKNSMNENKNKATISNMLH